MSPTLVAIDVGASRTRVKVGTDPDGFLEAGEPLIRDIGSASALLELLAEVREGIGGDGPVHLCGGLAAPPLGDEVRIMTNWPHDPRIPFEALHALGYQQVTLLNDLEAAAYGLVGCLEGALGDGHVVPFGGAEVPEGGNRALVIPGSGLGSAGIIDLGRDASPRWHVVASEAGHTLAGGEGEARILEVLEAMRGTYPTWEDCVSGPGLEAMWVAARPDQPSDPISAPEIALQAQMGDPRSREALEHYYRFAARFSQALALSFLSTGGLYLAGGTTRSNAPLISEESFLRTFYDNARMGPVLGKIPVFLVLAEINLLGAWREGWRRALG
jgi:glucokinase